jgi:hypothetical protein
MGTDGHGDSERGAIAMLDFPNSPSVGQTFVSGNTTWTWDGTKWLAAGTSGASSIYLPLAGGTLTGPLTVSAPTSHIDNAIIGATTPAAASVTSMNGGQLAGMRSLFINGNIDVDQRGGHGAAITAPSGTLTFPADRFWGYGSQASKLNLSSNQLLQLADGCGRVLQASVLAAVASMAAADVFMLGYRIEGLDAKRLLWGTANAKPLTVSFWAAASATGAYGFCACNGNASPRAYVTSFNLTANTWTKITLTIPGDTTGTWPTDNTLGLQINWTFAAGSQYVGTANAWQSVGVLAPPGIINAMATQGNVALEIARVQAEVGSVATPFEEVPVGLTNALCQRYYQRYVSNTAGAPYISGYANGAGAIGNLENMLLPVVMRAVPTVAVVGTWTFSNCSGINIDTTGTTYAVRVYSTASAAGMTILYPNVNEGFTLSAEL